MDNIQNTPKPRKPRASKKPIDMSALKRPVAAATPKTNGAAKPKGNTRAAKPNNNTSIMQDFDFGDFMKAKARKAGGGTDLVTAVNQLNPDIAKLKVGQTCQTKVPANVGGERKFLMAVVTKLNNLCSAGREWAGRKYRSALNDQGTHVYTHRDPDGAAKVMARGGGRKPGTVAKPATTGGAMIIEKTS